MISFIPAGMLASKIGRKKTVLLGLLMIIVSAGCCSLFNSYNILFLLLIAVCGIGWAMINCNSYPMIVEIANKSNIGKYTGFYYKILTEEGLQRSLSYNKSYSNSGSSSMIDRGINSETPQNSLLYDSQDPASDTKFDEAIATYASNIDKNKSATSSSSEGTSGTTATGVTWEEARKNVLLLFFNELKDFIMSIPERIYAWYSIDTMPFIDLHKEFIDYIKTLESQERKGMARSLHTR